MKHANAIPPLVIPPVCAVCGKPIVRGQGGLILWGQDATHVPYTMIHKGRCRMRAIQRWGETAPWSELSGFARWISSHLSADLAEGLLNPQRDR